jgi:hypothetical protein
MPIAEFICKEIIQPRLNKYGCLIVYDPEQRYRELCLNMDTDDCKVVDTTESSIESRLRALRFLREMGRPRTSIKSLLVYVPAKRPITEEQKQIDPFALYGECGAIFPKDDGDHFMSLCLRAKPENTIEIRRLFANNSSPGFDMVDAIGSGLNWPQLRATLKVESTNNILTALLAPNHEQRKAMKVQDGWEKEARELIKIVLGMDVKTRSKSWDVLADELWRFILFSEFVFDLPGELPVSLKAVPCGSKEVRAIVDNVCDNLRNDLRTRSIYIESAEKIEKDLNLPDCCREIEDLGEKDTFPFEERTFLRRAIDGIINNDMDRTRRVTCQT